MNRQDLKKQKELYYSKFFINWLNSVMDWDYQVVPNVVESSDVDVFANSDTSKPQLKLQNVTSNGETLKLAAKNKKHMEKDESFEVVGVKPEEWISKSIKDKEKKYGNATQDLILIVEGFMPVPSPSEVSMMFAKHKNSPFKGIFYISLPVLSSTRLDYEDTGYVYPIKPLNIT